jgi:hypothetical protein
MTSWVFKIAVIYLIAGVSRHPQKIIFSLIRETEKLQKKGTFEIVRSK